MKKSAILLVLLILVTFSCEKKYKFYAFDIKESVLIEIPVDSNEDFEITEEIDLRFTNLIDSKGSEADLIEEVTIEDVNLLDVDYMLFNELDLFISATNFSEILLADNDSTESTYNYLTGDPITKLNVSEEPMDDYVKASLINIKTVAKLDTQLIDDLYGGLPDVLTLSVNYNIRFRVKTYVK